MGNYALKAIRSFSKHQNNYKWKVICWDSLIFTNYHETILLSTTLPGPTKLIAWLSILLNYCFLKLGFWLRAQSSKWFSSKTSNCLFSYKLLHNTDTRYWVTFVLLLSEILLYSLYYNSLKLNRGIF